MPMNLPNGCFLQVERVTVSRESQGCCQQMKKRCGSACMRRLRGVFFVNRTGDRGCTGNVGTRGSEGHRATQTGAEPAVNVTGVVQNAATGHPLRRALVKVDSTPERGALTDGRGGLRFAAFLQACRFST